MQQAKDLCKWLLNCAILVYTAAESRNDFFLLHGVTGAWSLLQVVQSMDDHDQIVHSVYAFLVTLLAVYIRQKSPALNVQINCKQEIGNAAWERIVDETLQMQGEKADEHVYKLVHVVNDMRKDTKDPEKERIYACAARTCLDFNLYFI